jgi:uncharacterized membrane protein
MIKRFRSGSYFSLQTQQRLAWVLLIVLMVAFALVVGDQAVLRYETYKATAFDLGNMDQATWNTLHGHFLQFTNHSDNWYGPPIRLAQHVEPIFFLLALLYVFHADPVILLVFQTLAMMAGALPAFLLTRKALPTLPLMAPLIVLGYFLAPALLGQTLFDFHPVALVSPLFLFAALALNYRRYVWFVIACVLAAMCKEEIGAVAGLFCLVAIWKYRIPRLGLAIAIGGFAYTLICFLVIIPHFNNWATQSNFWYRYEALGATPAAAVKNILLHPWILFGVVITVNRIYYLAGLVRNTGFLALLAPEWLIPTLPELAINLLSSDGASYSGVYQYNAAIIPFVIIASIHGARRLYMFWYGLRGEAEEQYLLCEDVVLGRTTYAPGKPLPGSHVVLALVQGIWMVLTRVWHFLVERIHLGVLLAGLKHRFVLLHSRMRDLAKWLPISWLQKSMALYVVCMMVLNLIIIWPVLSSFLPTQVPGAREQEIQRLLDMIPPNAVVSAGGNINPHLTDRRYITVFPELTVPTFTAGQGIPVQYVIVDLDDVSPENKSFSDNFLDVLNQIQRTGEFKPIAQADGVLLLERVKQ